MEVMGSSDTDISPSAYPRRRKVQSDTLTLFNARGSEGHLEASAQEPSCTYWSPPLKDHCDESEKR